MPSSAANPAPAARRSPARLILPVLGAGVVVACVIALLRASSETARTAAEVREEIETLALRRGDRAGVPEGGLIGPWWVSASGVDPVSGRLVNFRISTDDLRIAAKHARVIIDTEHDTFSFELFDAVLTRIPSGGDVAGDARLLSLEHHLLGPADYPGDIIPDALPTAPTHLGTADPDD